MAWVLIVTGVVLILIGVFVVWWDWPPPKPNRTGTPTRGLDSTRDWVDEPRISDDHESLN